MNDDWHSLFNAALNGTITPEENARLADLLKSDPAARQLWYVYHDIEAGLGELPPVAAPSRKRAFTWNPLTAAAAGLAIGLFSASMVWGYVGSWSNRTDVLLLESFESSPQPGVRGMIGATGAWSGDYSELTGAADGVKPADGQTMLRFRRADYEGKPARDGYVADLFRIVDLRHVTGAAASIVVEAHYTALPQADMTGLNCGISILALDGLPPGGMHDDTLLRRLNANFVESAEPEDEPRILATAARSQKTPLSTGEARWTSVRSELSLPPDARYALIHLRAHLAHSYRKEVTKPVEFTGLFLDDIRITLAHRDS